MHVPPPPVPARLREMLKDYPGHIERLQEVLIRSVEQSRRLPVMPFDDAISALEGRLGTFMVEAREELDVAKMDGDSEMISRADRKFRLMFRARSGNGGMKGLHDLWEYFEKNKEVF